MNMSNHAIKARIHKSIPLGAGTFGVTAKVKFRGNDKTYVMKSFTGKYANKESAEEMGMHRLAYNRFVTVRKEHYLAKPVMKGKFTTVQEWVPDSITLADAIDSYNYKYHLRVHLGEQLLDFLLTCLELGLAYNDLSTSNILIKGNSLKIIDWGGSVAMKMMQPLSENLMKKIEKATDVTPRAFPFWFKLTEDIEIDTLIKAEYWPEVKEIREFFDWDRILRTHAHLINEKIEQ